MAASPFNINIADLRRNRAAPRRVSVTAPVAWGTESSATVTERPLEAHITLAPAAGGLEANGVIAVTVRHVCQHCLEEWDEQLSVDLAARFVDEALEDEDDYPLVGDIIDLEPVLRDEVVLAMPLLPQCEPDCEGLVGALESGLNTAAPGVSGDPASPFAVLKDLLEPGE